MEKRKLIIGTIMIALIALCGLSLFIGAMTVKKIDFRPGGWFHINSVWVEQNDSKTVKISGPLELEVHNFAGKVDIQAAEEDEVRIDFVKKAGGISQQVAKDNLEKITVDVSKSGSKLVVDTINDNNLSLSLDDMVIDLTIYVPTVCSVYVEDRFGDIRLSGTEGDVEIDGDFGSLTVSNVMGSLTADFSNGDISVENIDASSGAIDLKADFGGVTMKSIRAGSVVVKSSHGVIEIDDVISDEDINTENSFGAIYYGNVQAKNVIVDSKNGNLTLIDVEAEREIDASTDRGDIMLQRVAAVDYQVTSLNGRIDGNGLAGNLIAETDFGGIDFKECHADVLQLNSKNSDIAYHGSLGDGPHNVATDFGYIWLLLPDDTSLSLDVKTSFGTFETDFELQVTGDLSNHWKGKINDGDAYLEARTKNGDITINHLED